MTSVKTGIRSGETKFGADHILFVEGCDSSAIDATVLRILFENKIHIEALGPSFYVNSVAQALYPTHPKYYFLIDRDHYDDDFVNQCWINFPDPEKSNLLVWKRKEIENYFIDPDYLSQSTYCKTSKDVLGEKVIQYAKERLFIDAVNLVIVTIREEIKKNQIQIFTNSSDFKTKDKAFKELLTRVEGLQIPEKLNEFVSKNHLEELLNLFLYKMTGNQENLEIGKGDWLHRISGKEILNKLLNSSYFPVKDSERNLLQGKDKIQEIVKDLLRKPEINQPYDFILLKNLILQRIH